MPSVMVTPQFRAQAVSKGQVRGIAALQCDIKGHILNAAQYIQQILLVYSFRALNHVCLLREFHILKLMDGKYLSNCISLLYVSIISGFLYFT